MEVELKKNKVMAYYIKVTKEVAESMGLTSVRNKTKDDNCLLWQADVARYPGATIFERAAYVGGVALTPQAAKAETDGVDNPASVHTPVVFGGSGMVYMENVGNVVDVEEEAEVPEVTETETEEEEA